MCTVCGCGEPDKKSATHTHEHPHDHAHDHAHEHQHDHEHDHEHHHYGHGEFGAHVPGLSQKRMIQIEQGILEKNDGYARNNRLMMQKQGILSLNLLSSPGAGKTTLLSRTIKALPDNLTCKVIEGDQETSHDADKIRETGAQAIQINTGKGCHLDAHQVGHAMEELALAKGEILFIENVGNLVCPAGFDLGEDAKVVILSVTEGEDKPLKYQQMFHNADLILINKIDLLPYLDFDLDKCLEYIEAINPGVKTLQISATSGAGMQNWQEWLSLKHQLKQL